MYQPTLAERRGWIIPELSIPIRKYIPEPISSVKILTKSVWSD